MNYEGHQFKQQLLYKMKTVLKQECINSCEKLRNKQF
jgi:hypothetical protein